MQRQVPGDDSVAVPLRAAGVVLLIAHLLLLVWISLRPVEAAWVSASNLHPLAGIRADFALGWWPGVCRMAREMVTLAPLGFLLPLAFGRLNASAPFSLVRTTAAGLLVATWVGLLRSYASGQVMDVDTLLLNVAGVLAAHVAVVPWGRAVLRRRRDAARAAARKAQGPPPTIARGELAPWGDALRRS